MTAKTDWRATQKEVENRVAALAFLSVDGIGRRSWRKMKSKLAQLNLEVAQAWSETEKLASVLGLEPRQSAAVKDFKKKWSQAGDYVEYLQAKGITAILADDEGKEGLNYPALLREVVDAPEILFVRGEVKNLRAELPVAMVGTRRMTYYGRQSAEKLARELALLRATVVSGFMYGIDVTAQKAAMSAGGKTVGVLGFGMDFCFPRSQTRLMEEMVKAGQTFVSEYAPWVTPSPGTFPERNRIVAGMSWGTVVVEAAEKSGSLITAQLAVDCGREVMAVPGPINSLYFEGTKKLLQAGATLVSSGREIIAQLHGGLGGNVHERNLKTAGQGCPWERESDMEESIEKELNLGENQWQVQIIKKLKKAPLGLTFDQLQIETGLEMVILKTETMLLDLAQKIKIEGDLVLLS